MKVMKSFLKVACAKSVAGCSMMRMLVLNAKKISVKSALKGGKLRERKIVRIADQKPDFLIHKMKKDKRN